MPRPRGRRNADFDAKRVVLARALSTALVDDRGAPTSLGALAATAGVTVPTLKHYFGDHDGVVQAALEEAERAGAEHLEQTRRPGRRKLPSSMRAVAEALAAGWRFGLGSLFAGALMHGLGHERRGMAAVEHLLEPTLQALEVRLACHAERGELRQDADLRVAALAFAAPLILALLHQHQLAGAKCRPLELGAFMEQHVDGWLRAYGR